MTAQEMTIRHDPQTPPADSTTKRIFIGPNGLRAGWRLPDGWPILVAFFATRVGLYPTLNFAKGAKFRMGHPACYRLSSGITHSNNSRAFTTSVCRHCLGKWRLFPVTR